MANTDKINNMLKNITSVFKDEANDEYNMINRANDTLVEVKQGIIDSLYIENDAVFAIIRKNYGAVTSPDGYQVEHGDGWFNGPDRSPIDEALTPELAIPTNISAVNTNLARYIDKPCRVTVKDNIAVFAEVELGLRSLTKIPAATIIRIRRAVENRNETLFSEVGKRFFKDEGYSDEDIKALSDFTYVQEQTGKINTFSGEGLWFKDTSNKDPNENILEANSLLTGLNKLGMKSKKCHIPSRLFSGK